MLNRWTRPVNSHLRGSRSTFFRQTAQPRRTYPRRMLGRLQDRRGEPNLRTRMLAALVVVGMVVLTAPLVVIPLVHWLAGFV